MTIGSNDVRSNDLGSNNIGSNDKLSKRRQRVELKKLYALIQGWVRLRQFVGRTLRLGQARGPSDAFSSSKFK